ncbi:hypothetical protein [Marinospirillum insulare]|uniref:Uncharacterized protein n=1 Tax=Marinospirillum insulare TaxID=217169 RepID=A0ABQ5ZXZ6_9GAMM|nr:hypothetical protein [Marinospirillum insulare]GLR62810.1 hypothetical protein GCM10007878_02450 [Marinospirillum insulare]
MARSMVWVTPTAKEMAYELIMELRIKQGRGLSIFLGCPISYDNYSAIQQWVQRLMTETQMARKKLTETEIRSRFLDRIPLHLQGVID